MKLSIVTTLYKSAPYVNEFYKRVSSSAQALTHQDYEIVLVNDGSPDNCLELATSLADADAHVVVVDLSRNFGHHKAMMTGLAYAQGEKVFLIDSDLEESPEWVIEFDKQLISEKADVVYGVQRRRKGSLTERYTGALFYKIFRFLSGLDLPENIVVARLMSRRYVNALLGHRESEIFMAGLWLLTGFKQVPQIVDKLSRASTTYTFRKKVSQLVNSVTSFSSKPLVGIFLIGLCIFGFASLYSIYLVVNWFFLSVPPSGYTSMMASIWLLGGLVSASVGVVGIYLSKIYSETKQRPYTIVRQVYKKAGERP